MIKYLFVTICFFNLFFLLSCKENNKSVYFNHPIPDYKEILNTRYAKYDNNTHIINHLNEFAYYKQAIIQTKKENWNDFTNIFLKNIEIPDSLRTISAEIYIDTILEANDIVLLNETHDLPQHRVLAHSFLENLKAAGYKYIAVEALNNNPEKTAFTEGLINYNSAIYTKEPYFVNFLNQTKKMGFNLIDYEPWEYDHKIKGNRDIMMAKNIKRKCDLRKGKLFIYCGWGHLENKKYWLRYYLNKEFPQRKIASINQAWLNAEHPNDYQDKIRKMIGEIDYPAFLMKENKPYTLDKSYDFEIIHPVYDSELSNIPKIFNKLYTVKKIKNPLHKKSIKILGFDNRFDNKFDDIVPSVIVHNKETKTLKLIIPIRNKYNFYTFGNNYLKRLKISGL